MKYQKTFTNKKGKTFVFGWLKFRRRMRKFEPLGFIYEDLQHFEMAGII